MSTSRYGLLTSQTRSTRQCHFDRIILHYFQPHIPYSANALAEDRPLREYERKPGKYYRETGDMETIWNAYLDEVRYVLDDVELLLDNIDADRIAISADHGEAFSEYGIRGHEIGSLYPKIRKVPWTTTAGTDHETHVPTIESPSRRSERTGPDPKERLKDLGYRM